VLVACELLIGQYTCNYWSYSTRERRGIMVTGCTVAPVRC